MPPLTIVLGGEPVTIAKGSFSAENAIEERSTCSFTVIDEPGAKQYRKGQPVTVWGEDDFPIFGGVVDTARADIMAPSGGLLHDISCVGWQYLADKRIAAASYTDEFAGAIVRDLVARYLADEGIRITEWAEGDQMTAFLSPWFPAGFTSDTNYVQDGPKIREAVFNYVPVSQALDVLAEKAGFWWGIDAYKRLFFLPRTAKKASRVATRDDMRKGSIRVTHGNPKYRNRQYIKGGTDITSPQTERHKGDGEAQSFTVGFPIAKAPTIKVNGSTQTVGIKGVDEGRQWYWAKRDPVITQERGDTPLTSSDMLEVVYEGEFPIVFLSFDQEAINDRKLVEGGGTGFVEEVDDEPETNSRDAAGQSANKKLEKYAVIGRRVQFTTWKPGLEAGTLLTVNLPEWHVEGAEMLIDSVKVQYDGTVVWYTVSAVEGPSMGSWTRLFTELARRAKPFVIRENISEEEVLVTLETFSKTWQEAERPNPFYEIYPGPDVFPGPDTYPMFHPGDEVKYLAWYDSTGERGRRQITQREDSPGEIFTVTLIAPTEAVGTITHLGWWGGWQASDEVGTGVELDKQPYAKEKTELESIQVEKTDIKGW